MKWILLFSSLVFSDTLQYSQQEMLESLSDSRFHVQVNDTLELVVEKLSLESKTGGFVYQGKVQGELVSNAFFFFNGKILNGSISWRGNVFQFLPISEETLRVQEVNLQDLESEGEGLIEDEEVEDSALEVNQFNKPPVPMVEDVSIIDVIVLYSANYSSSFSNNNTLIEAEIETRIQEANLIYQNSGIDIELVLLHHQEVNIPDNLTSGSTLASYSVAQDLREQYGADLVSFWNINGSAGSAQNYNGSSRSAYSTARKSRIQSGYTFVHEIGHNMGAKHDRQTYVDQGRSDELTQSLYRYGLSFTDYRSVMSYDNCSSSSCNRIMHFTNPNVLYNGVPTGIAVGDLDPANNARRLNDNRVVISNFRTRQITLSSSQELSSSQIISSSEMSSSSMQSSSSETTVSILNSEIQNNVQIIQNGNTLEIQVVRQTEVQIYNSLGKMIESSSFDTGNHLIHLNHLPEGKYWVKFNESQIQSIIILPTS